MAALVCRLPDGLVLVAWFGSSTPTYEVSTTVVAAPSGSVDVYVEVVGLDECGVLVLVGEVLVGAIKSS